MPRPLLPLLLSLVASAHADPATLRAKTEELVVQELMGGCSLKCAFGWTVEVQPNAGEGKASTTKALNDDNAETAWIAPEGTSGVGTKLRLLFPKKIRTELEGTPLYGLDLANGVCMSEEQWKKHGRVKKIRLHYNDKPFRDLLFADSRHWQRLEFPDILAHSGDTMTLEILEIYPGEKGAGAAITEVALQGAH